MQQNRAPGLEDQQPIIDAMLYNGVDILAARRAHMRELTAARQAAEQLQSRQRVQAPLGPESDAGAGRQRTIAMYAELSRLNDEHRAWELEQGITVRERPGRLRRARPSLES